MERMKAAFEAYIEEMEHIACVRRECSVIEIDAFKELMFALKGDEPERVHSVFEKGKRLDHGL